MSSEEDSEPEEVDEEESEEEGERDAEDIIESGPVTNVINKSLDLTSDRIQRAELAGVLANRTSEIENGGKVFVDITGCSSAHEIALKELIEHKNPYIIQRLVSRSNGTEIYETIPVRNLTIDASLLGAFQIDIKKK